MKRKYLELKTCRTEKAEFIRGKVYVVLDKTSEHTYDFNKNKSSDGMQQKVNL